MSFRNFKNRTFILIFLGILVFPWVGGGVLRVVAPSTYEKLSMVETEKRDMAEIKWSELASTGESISSFIDDRIPFRYTMISWYKALNDKIDSKYQVIETAIGSRFYTASVEEEEPVDRGETNKPIVPAEEVPQETVTEEVAEVDNYFPLHVYQDVIIARDGWLFLYGENEFECYQGTNILSSEEMHSYADKLNELQAICDAQGKELYVYIAPNKSNVYTKYMPTVDIVEPYRRIQQLNNCMKEYCNAKFIYPIETELVASGRYQVYYKYDSHWNHLGALFGTNELYDYMGIAHEDPSVYITGTQDADKYELYTYMGIPDDRVTHDDVEQTVDYKPEITVEGLNLDSMICRTTSNGANAKSLCLIGDSFRVNMMPYLSKDFTSCTFCHRDYMSEIHSDIKNANVIVIEAVERYDYEAFTTAQRVINILTQ